MTADELREALYELDYQILVGAPSYSDAPDQKKRGDFAHLVRVAPETVSRWLSGKLPVPSYIEVIIGLLRENYRLEARLKRTEQRPHTQSGQAA